MDSDGIKLEIKGSKRIEINWRKQSSCSLTWTNCAIRIMNAALSLPIAKAKVKIGWVTQFSFSDKKKHSSL